MTILFTPVGEHALRFALPPHLDRRALLEHLRALPGVSDASLAAEHALVVFHGSPADIVLPEALAAAGQAPVTHEIRVTYDGPDLPDVARALGLEADAVVALHTGRAHAALFLGFCPGFAYLGPLAPALEGITRRPAPRARVPAGTVALAGGYTGIYPADTPGCWLLFWRSVDFDAFVGERTRFAVGDLVRFVPA
jgi:allophanate hydrolase subunit 1